MFYRALSASPVRARRARPVLALAAVAFATGAIVGANRTASPANSLASSFVAAWTRGDYTSMYLDVDPATRRTVSPAEFVSAYRKALRTATATASSVAGGAHNLPGGVVEVPVRVRTKLFGVLKLALRVRFSEAQGRTRIAWSPSLAFPGLQPGEMLARRTALPPRATLLARDGSVLAEGSARGAGQRASPLGAVASAVPGDVAPPEGGRRLALEAQGVPPDAIVGERGLERALDARLRGAPGGELLAVPTGAEAGGRVLASAVAHPAAALRTTISPTLERAAVTALGGRYGGVVAMKPATGEILAVAGIGIDSVQPPGSTFKLVTAAAALESGITPNTLFSNPAQLDLPQTNHALQNFGGEHCLGGAAQITLAQAFQVSCNVVFGQVGLKIGADALVTQAQKFGFDGSVPFQLPWAEGQIPQAGDFAQALPALAFSAIGQEDVLANPLQMALVAGAVAHHGIEMAPRVISEIRDPSGRVVRKVDPVEYGEPISVTTASELTTMMVSVVQAGTGTAAQIPGITVAGKTGTAQTAGGSPHAWFVCFAPAEHPQIVVAVVVLNGGSLGSEATGGHVAAPIARAVLEAALRG